ncbi:MAG: cysteine peptidase family C39 domain-containing protein [Acidobacteriota bacterium]
MKNCRLMVLIMTAAMTTTCALWFPHHFLSDTQFLGRDGVFFQQSHSDCGGAALKMIFDHFCIPMDYGLLLQRLGTGPEGTTMLSIRQVAVAEGLRCEGWRLAPRDLPAIPLPAILLLRRSHFVVLESVNAAGEILILDPVRGKLRISVQKLLSVWKGETLLFSKPGTDADQYRRWFARRNHGAARSSGRVSEARSLP